MENKLPEGLVRGMILRAVGGLVILGACFFLPAWTFKYWQAWLYLAVIFGPLLFIIIYFLKKNPEFLVRRMKMNEKATEQKWIVGLSGIPLTLAFILPGFDVRLGWSKVPDWLVWISAFLVLAGYIFVVLVFRENNFASRVVEVTEGQKVIETGPYSIVRHPMYLGSIIMYVLTPLALGSAWAVIPALLMIPVLILRIINEEKLLINELPGYAEYRQKVRYRLFPGIW